MGKHTPGPWVFRNGCDIFSELGADSGDGCPAASNDGWHVATIPDTETNIDGAGKTELGWNVKRANAHLIAAAPELLEALEVALNGLRWYVAEYTEKANGCDDEAIAKIEAAIARATGATDANP